jgi:hypothetical protein
MSFSSALGEYSRSQRDLFLTMFVEAPRAAPLSVVDVGFVSLGQAAAVKGGNLENKNLVEGCRRLRILSKA